MTPGAEAVESNLRASFAAQKACRFDDMLERANLASEADTQDLRARFRRLECQLYCGYPDRAMADLEALEADAGSDSQLWCRIGEYYSHCLDFDSALACYERALALDPENPEILFALAAAEIAAGRLDAAEEHLGEAIRHNPDDYDAYRNRSTLRKVDAESNHIAEIESLLDAGVKRPAGEVQLCYALAKEYEDLGEYERSFEFLKRGADRRRSLLDYRVEGDVAVLARLRSVFDETLLTAGRAGCEEAGPVFVMGLPRSGTTLVDRILSSHSAVSSLGEINNFAYSLLHTVGRAADKVRLVEYAAQVDFAALGRRYMDAVRRYGRPGPLLIDKTPLNYLYVGLIRLALPAARIVHVERDPMDSCFGMYRALFRAGYPFSYDFDDLGKYYVAYRQLMDHWREVAGDGLLDVGYESLVDDQERVSRDVVEYCGLEWESACLDFHRNPAPVATASSAQVRQPVYRDALQRWRRYERQLRPLADFLRREGIAVDAE